MYNNAYIFHLLHRVYVLRTNSQQNRQLSRKQRTPVEENKHYIPSWKIGVGGNWCPEPITQHCHNILINLILRYDNYGSNKTGKTSTLFSIHESRRLCFAIKTTEDVSMSSSRDSPEQNRSFPQIESRDSCTQVSNPGHDIARYSQPPPKRTCPSHEGSQRERQGIESSVWERVEKLPSFSTLESSLPTCSTCKSNGQTKA